MTGEEFDEIVDRRVQRIVATLKSKGDEYQRGPDRLSNFKRCAELERCTPARTVLGKWSKHVVSVVDLVLDLEAGRMAPAELWDEKITDAVNYLVLLEGIVADARKEQEAIRADHKA